MAEQKKGGNARGARRSSGMPQCGGRVNTARLAIALGPALGYVLGMEHIPSTETTEAQAARPGRKRYADVPLAEKLAVITAWLEEHKAERIVSLNLTEQGGFTDVLLVLTAGPKTIRLLPPLVISQEEMDTGLAALKDVLVP